MGKIDDLTGRTFGRWKVLAFCGLSKHRAALWECECECGNRRLVIASNLKQGLSMGCKPCAKAGAGNSQYVDGRMRTPTHNSWRGMLERCTNPKHFGYKWYGGLGVTVCERWREDYANFLADMGERPEGRTIDRIDPYGNYEPGNCRWATPKEQGMNKRKRKRAQRADTSMPDYRGLVQIEEVV